jgi:hypothetical protein
LTSGKPVGHLPIAAARSTPGVKQLEPLGVITAGRGQQRGRRLLLQQVGLESVLLMDTLVSSQPARPRPLTVTPAVAMGILADRDCFPPRGAVHTCGRTAAIRTNDTRRATPVRHLAGRHRGGAGPDGAGDGPRQSALRAWEWRSGRGGIIPRRHSAEGSSIGARSGDRAWRRQCRKQDSRRLSCLAAATLTGQ